ncbi:hypothetical protein D3C77_769600 [compost metagenome]
MPVALGEQRIAVGVDLAIHLGAAVVVDTSIDPGQVQVGQRAVVGEVLVAGVLPVQVSAEHVIESLAHR